MTTPDKPLCRVCHKPEIKHADLGWPTGHTFEPVTESPQPIESEKGCPECRHGNHYEGMCVTVTKPLEVGMARMCDCKHDKREAQPEKDVAGPEDKFLCALSVHKEIKKRALAERDAEIESLVGALKRISRADRNGGASYGWCATEADKALADHEKGK